MFQIVDPRQTSGTIEVENKQTWRNHSTINNTDVSSDSPHAVPTDGGGAQHFPHFLAYHPLSERMGSLQERDKRQQDSLRESQTNTSAAPISDQ